ncbi:hypothetical protein PG997_013667 [Apiospora hydei]|uniref:EGF domain-specific O-linked N-acetylglucosamine transferase n=1 Tax=Apiospora hydei TaxID=1337664 RepID=A0ABR1V9H3_9PEZI
MSLNKVLRPGLRARNVVIFALLISTTLVLLSSRRVSTFVLLESLGSNTETLSSILSSTPPPSHSSSLPIPLPSGYQNAPGQEGYCEQRYTTRYLETLREGEVSYCSPGSPSQLTCFHTPSDFHDDGHIDSFCIAQGSAFNAATNRFELGCSLRPDAEVPLSKLHPYWYRTGPWYLFHSHFSIAGPESPAWHPDAEASAKRTFSILVKREGPGNIFHVFHEIMSMTYTMDVLQMSRDPQTGKPRFSQEDIANTQVVIMDSFEDGGFIELWRLMSDRPIKRLSELVAEDPEWLTNNGNTIILPLAGGSNPVWHQTPEDHNCINQLREVFSKRVLDFYQIPQDESMVPTQGEPAPRPLTLTFINRTATRQLNNADGLLDEIRSRFRLEDVHVQSVNFARLPLRDQIQVARATDILVGVHGAGLMHALFMAARRGAVVEIFPATLDFNALRAIALERGLAYYSTHDTTREYVRPWQEESLDVDEGCLGGW